MSALIALTAVAGHAADPAYPATPKRPVSDTYHGVTVVDDYRWLEDDAAADVKAWTAAQNKFARAYFDAIPARPQIARRVAELLSKRPVRRDDLQLRVHLFALKHQPPRNQPLLVMMPSNGDTRRERVVVDPNKLDPTGRTTIDFFRPSYDGRHVVVSLSAGGSEEGSAYVFDVATGRRLPEVVPRVSGATAGGSVEWAPDNSGFYYTRYPADGERPAADRHFYQTVWFHTLGTPTSADWYVIGRDFPRIAEVMLQGSRDGQHLLAQVANGDGGELAFHLRDRAGQWTQVAGFADGVKEMSFGDDGRLYAMSIKDAPRGQVLAITLAEPVLARATVVVPEAPIVAESATATASRLYVRYRDGGPSTVRMFGLDGKPAGDLPTTPVSEVTIGEHLAGDDVLVHVVTYVSAPTWLRYDARANKLVPTTLNGGTPTRFADATVTREFATSKDGTKVPVNLIHRTGLALDGRQPVLLVGYGAYGLSLSPWFDPLVRLWLDYGGVFAIANLRGGGEFGEPWHVAGMLTRKQNVFDDFAACMQHLVERKYTSPERLAIRGGSNGGLTVGAALTQHPQAMRAVVGDVGTYDVLRWEVQPNGEFNTTEFGSVKDAAQFKAMFDYSPLLRVRDGVAYPAVLLTTGAQDGRVAPFESRKMAARLQAATKSGYPVLLRTEAEAGHGIGTSLAVRIGEATDRYAFLVDQLGMAPPAGKGRTRK